MYRLYGIILWIDLKSNHNDNNDDNVNKNEINFPVNIIINFIKFEYTHVVLL